MAKYAARTTVSPSKSLAEIQDILHKYGATSFGFMLTPEGVMIGFESKGRRLRFKVRMPNEKTEAQEHRQRWRALLMAIKSKLENVESGIETFDEAFLAQIVLPDGRTMAEYSVPQIESSYKSGKMPPLLGHD